MKIRAIIIIAYYLIFIITSSILKRKDKTEKGVKKTDKFDFSSIPLYLRWLPLLSIVGLTFFIVYPIIFLFYPNIYNFMFPIVFLQTQIFFIISCVIIVIGEIIVLICQLELGKSYRYMLTDNKTDLVTNGLYSRSRNPLYVGAFLSLFGLVMLFPSIVLFAFYIVSAVNNHFRVMEEEKFLGKRFGDQYLEYCNNVRRYF